jgi:hypothetical protein
MTKSVTYSKNFNSGNVMLFNNNLAFFVEEVASPQEIGDHL